MYNVDRGDFMPISHNTFMSQLDFDKYENFFDISIKDTAAHKKVKMLTLRNYKEKLESGLSPKMIISEGYDKHLVGFYNALLKNKINLTRDQFEHEYLKGQSLDSIAKAHRISRENITFLREIYGIKRKGATFINRKKTEPTLTKRQKQIIVGSFLGDGGRMSPSSLKIKHSIKQKKYLLWKYEQLISIASPVSLQEDTFIDSRFKSPIHSIRFYTFANSFIESLITMLYSSGVKTVTKKYMDMVDDLALTIWFCDDGDTDWNHRSLIKGHNTQPTCKINSQSFSKQECKMMCEWFLNKYSIEANVREKKSALSGNVGYIIKFNTSNTAKLHEIIRHHMIESMKYKVSLTHYLQHTGRRIDKCSQFTAKKCPIGSGFFNLTHADQEKWIDGALYHIRRSRFPYPRLNSEDKNKYLHKILGFDSDSLYKQGDILYKSDGSSFIVSFHKHFYEMNSKGSDSLYKMYSNDAILKDVIRYVIGCGTKPQPKAISHSLRRYRGNKTVGSFPVLGAKAVYDKYCPKNANVLDFCAGFGNRLVGAWASDNVIKYTGIDACAPTVHGLNNIKLECNKIRPKEFTILHDDSKHLLDCIEGFYDFCFTSPPYFDREHYSDDPLQSSVMYDNYAEWLHEWLFSCIESVTKLLTSGGVLAINVANCVPYMIADDTFSYLTDKGFTVKCQKLYISTQKPEPLLIVRI